MTTRDAVALTLLAAAAGVVDLWRVVSLGPAVLGGAAVTMGARSVLALRLGESTTYMTGTVTGVLRDVATGGVLRRLAGLRVVGALVVGAGVAGVLLALEPPVVPGLAALLVALAAVVHAWPRPAPQRDEPHHDHPTRRS